MDVKQNVSLADYSTMRLGGVARFLVTVRSEDELLQALAYGKEQGLRTHLLGGGSNTIFTNQGFDGLVIVNKIMGIAEEPTDDTLILSVGAGENWDTVVALSVKHGYSDIAALSLIPGTAGAAPVQNIGAYGQQISDSLVSLRAYDMQNDAFVELMHDECGFLYRQSRFNTTDKGRYIITVIKLQLSRKNISPPFYADVAAYFKQHGIDQNAVSAAQLREAVSTVRVVKLPDPSTVANSGSFFKNPVISQSKFERLQQRFPNLKAHQTDDGNLKLYGAQLIELAGMKDFHDPETGMATWKNQALVLVNESARSAEDLVLFKRKIIDAVQEMFSITLVQEPELIER